MFFEVLKARRDLLGAATNRAYLINDNWNDFGYCTQFQLVVFDEDSQSHQLGDIKIGQKGQSFNDNLPEGHYNRSTILPEKFDNLTDDFYSLGQNEDYYEVLSTLSEGTRSKVLIGLRDCAADLTLFESSADRQLTCYPWIASALN